MIHKGADERGFANITSANERNLKTVKTICSKQENITKDQCRRHTNE